MQPTTVQPLRTWRTARKLSQEALAALAGVDPSVISRVERGLIHPHPTTCRKVCDPLHIAPQQVEEFTRARDPGQAVYVGSVWAGVTRGH